MNQTTAAAVRVLPSLVAPAVCVAAAVGTFSVVLAVLALRSDSMKARLRAVPPSAKCFVAGLLAGVGLLVMLPSALKSALQQKSVEPSLQRLMLFFCSAPLVMYMVHHLILGHTHSHDDAASCECEPPVKRVQRALIGKRATFCPPVPEAGMLPGPGGKKSCPPSSVPPSPGSRRSRLYSACAEGALVLLRALPYTLHATIDGALLGTTQSPATLASLALSVALCAVQDVGTILVNLAATGASKRAMLVTTALFGMGFPLGSSLILVMTAASTASAAGSDSAEGALSSLRAFAAGLFIYMALFELAPPHASERLTHLRYLLAFTCGLAIAYMSEVAEDWIVVPTPRLVSTAGWTAVESSLAASPTVAAALMPGAMR